MWLWILSSFCWIPSLCLHCQRLQRNELHAVGSCVHLAEKVSVRGGKVWMGLPGIGKSQRWKHTDNAGGCDTHIEKKKTHTLLREEVVTQAAYDTNKTGANIPPHKHARTHSVPCHTVTSCLSAPCSPRLQQKLTQIHWANTPGVRREIEGHLEVSFSAWWVRLRNSYRNKKTFIK